jgi:bacterioferritin
VQGEPKVIEYLNASLRHELTAVNQYWLHYRLLDNWGYKALAKHWRKESIEEMPHADDLTVRIIFLEGFPNLQVLDPLQIGQTVKEVLDCDLKLEMAARALYQEAATHCHAVKDYVSRDLFERLMRDEEKHIDLLETQLDLASARSRTIERRCRHGPGLWNAIAYQVFANRPPGWEYIFTCFCPLQYVEAVSPRRH